MTIDNLEMAYENGSRDGYAQAIDDVVAEMKDQLCFPYCMKTQEQTCDDMACLVCRLLATFTEWKEDSNESS